MRKQIAKNVNCHPNCNPNLILIYYFDKAKTALV